MNQSAFIGGFLLAGFVLWLAANNRLSAYTAVLWGTPSAPSAGTGSSGNAAGNSGTGTPAASSNLTSSIGGAVGSATASVVPSISVVEGVSNVADFLGLAF